jgi:hypothetical protein
MRLDFGPIVALLVTLFVTLRAKQAKSRKDRDKEQAPPPVPADSGEAERTRRVREEVQRRIAERRAGQPAGPLRRLLEPDGIPTLDPFGGPGRRGFAPPVIAVEEEPAPAPEPPPLPRPAPQAAPAAFRPAPENPAPQAVERSPLLDDLRDRTSLRKVVVLREILGKPVGLR